MGNKKKRQGKKINTHAIMISHKYTKRSQKHFGKCHMMNHKMELRSLGDNINSLRYANDTTLVAERKKKNKRLLLEEVKGE